MIKQYYLNSEIILQSDKNITKGFFEIKKGKFFIVLLSADKTSIRREIGIGSAIDMAKLICDAVEFKCKKCKKVMSIERGEVHHGCLSCP